MDSEVLLRDLVRRRQLVSFFNDVKVSDPDPAIPAAQYFATKGFFNNYNARLDEPLTEALQKVWREGFDRLKTGTLDPGELAARVHNAESTKSLAVNRTRGEVILEMWNELTAVVPGRRPAN